MSGPANGETVVVLHGWLDSGSHRLERPMCEALASKGIREESDQRFFDAFAKSTKERMKIGNAIITHWNLLSGETLNDNTRAAFLRLNKLDGRSFAAAGLGFRQLQVASCELRRVRIRTLETLGVSL